MATMCKSIISWKCFQDKTEDIKKVSYCIDPLASDGSVCSVFRAPSILLESGTESTGLELTNNQTKKQPYHQLTTTVFTVVLQHPDKTTTTISNNSNSKNNNNNIIVPFYSDSYSLSTPK